MKKPRTSRYAVGSWMVWHKNGRKPSFCHPTRELAMAEAERLAAKTPGKRYLVLKIDTETVTLPPEEVPADAMLAARKGTGDE